MRPRTTTPEERAHVERVRSLPCICCEDEGRIQDSPTEAHHLVRSPRSGQTRGMGMRKPTHFETVPLCRGRHHWNGAGVNIPLCEFEARWGNELDLLERTYQRLGLPYPWPRRVA